MNTIILIIACFLTIPVLADPERIAPNVMRETTIVDTNMDAVQAELESAQAIVDKCESCSQSCPNISQFRFKNIATKNKIEQLKKKLAEGAAIGVKPTDQP